MPPEDDEEEEFIIYGEPLEDEEDASRENPAAVENQVVKDAQGRRRFHGAFTGGFSAGYFNSVGSKEGWTPATFVSSRQNRSEKKNQSVEDFMDAEDLGEYGIAPRQVKTADKFSSASASFKRPVTVEPSAIPGSAPLEDLVVVTNDSIGAQILKKMGWREGQGVGPKVKKYKKKKGKGKGVEDHGKTRAESTNESEHDQFEERMKEFMFGPNDVKEVVFQMKSDLKGLGYRGISQDTSVLGGHINLFGSSHPIKGKEKTKGIKGSAFGVGAFEEPDGDIYATDDMNMYDRILGGEDNSEDTFGWTAPKSKDGAGSCLDGFSPASDKKKCITKVFPPPALPPGFQPVHIFTENLAPKGDKKSTRFTLSSAQRSALLGEEVLPGKPPSSESTSLALVLKDDKARLTSSEDGDVSSVQASKTNKKSRFSDLLPHQDSATSVRREPTTEGITEWERQRGKSESLQGSALYNPISSMMSSRFVSAKYADEEQVEYSAENEVDKSHHENAAEMKMYGKLTRETFEWHPDHVICKRFNVPQPYPGSTAVGIPGMKRDKVSVFSFLSIPGNPAETISKPADISATQVPEKQKVDVPLSTKSETNKRTRWDIKPAILNIIEERRKNPSQEVGGGEKEEGNEEQEEDSRPPMDLFSAIFNETYSSDSNSSEEDEDEAMKDNNMTSQNDEKLTVPWFNEKSEASNRVDVDPVTEGSTDHSKVINTFSEDSSSQSQLQKVTTSAVPHRESSEEDEQYGPALPPPLSGHTSVDISPSCSQSHHTASSMNSFGKHSSSHRKHKKHHRTSDLRRHHQKHKSHHRKKEKRKKERKHKRDHHGERRGDRNKHKKHSKDSSDSSYSSSSEG